MASSCMAAEQTHRRRRKSTARPGCRQEEALGPAPPTSAQINL